MMRDTNILVWLPSPMGDAILCTPALRAISQHFKSCRIWFLAEPVAREILSPNSFNNDWLMQRRKNPFTIAKMLKEHKFTHAILFKNSFASALAVFLARISSRVGYAREGRGPLLTDKLYPPILPNGKFKPVSMVDYYLAIASRLGADVTDRNLELLVNLHGSEELRNKLPEVVNAPGPVVVIVPGGAFGSSKCWPSERFAQTADRLINNYNATVVVSVSPDPAEKKIGHEICNSSRNKLINLSEKNVSLGELKALFSRASLVITNDTGPRHIAIALQRKVVTLFGPNDPAWTETNYENEIQIVGNVPCAPCTKPLCKKSQHLCMQAISTEMVYDAAKQLLGNNRKQAVVYARRKFVETSDSLFIDPDYVTAFDRLGLTSIDAVFSLSMGKDPGGSSLPRYRNRLQFEVSNPAKSLFLKRYDHPGALTQIKNWFSHHSCKSMMFFDLEPIENLACAGINTPKLASYGEQWGIFFEKRSFTITEEIPHAEPLEQKPPDCFRKHPTTEVLKQRRQFIKKLGQFTKKFHDTGYRHRDFYLAHIFYSDDGTFYLIDLQRVFKPWLFAERFRVKDIAQLYYSAPRSAFSRTDRLRFYKWYTGKDFLDRQDKIFIYKVISKVKRIVRHDTKHGRLITLYADWARG
jgi:heptosyltransferase-2